MSEISLGIDRGSIWTLGEVLEKKYVADLDELLTVTTPWVVEDDRMRWKSKMKIIQLIPNPVESRRRKEWRNQLHVYIWEKRTVENVQRQTSWVVNTPRVVYGPKHETSSPCFTSSGMRVSFITENPHTPQSEYYCSNDISIPLWLIPHYLSRTKPQTTLHLLQRVVPLMWMNNGIFTQLKSKQLSCFSYLSTISLLPVISVSTTTLSCVPPYTLR